MDDPTPPRPVPGPFEKPASRELQFAPFSGESSTRLRVVSIYLRLNAIGLLGIGIQGAIRAIRAGEFSEAWAAVGPVGVLVVVGTAAAMWWSGRDLARRLKRGAFSAAAAFAVPLVAIAFGAVPPEAIVVSLLGLGAIASVWSELE